MHAGQRSMESAVRSDARCEQLLDELVLKYSMAGDSKQPGSLARALANSAKLAAMFRRHAEEFNSVDLLMGKAYEAPHFAAQRFDSLLIAVEKLLQNLEAVINLLIELAATKCDQSKWARQLLSTVTLLQQARRAPLGCCAPRRSRLANSDCWRWWQNGCHCAKHSFTNMMLGSTDEGSWELLGVHLPQIPRRPSLTGCKTSRPGVGCH